MFCPRCGIALSQALETCSGCGVDLRPLAETGFFTSLRGITPDTEGTMLAGTPFPGGASDPDATMLGAPGMPFPGGATDPDATMLGAPGMPFPGGADDADATRLGAPALSWIGRAGPADDDTTRRTPAVGAKPPSGTGVKRPGTGGSRPGSRPGTGGLRPGTGGAQAASEGPLQTGENFGSRYHIIRLLGIGGMGAVYQAWDSELEVALAFKVIRPEAMDDPVAAAEIEGRFKRELLLARQVTHPNVVRIHDLGEIDGIKYITMPYVEGKDLSDILAETETMPVPRVLKIAKQVVSGLCAAHEAGVVHRDLKPANIMIDAEDHALIMDFGIARATSGPADAGGGTSALSRTADAGETRVGTVVGTIEYMAPEQARAEALDHRADIYAFGRILYRMIVGKRWAEGASNAYEDLMARMKAEPTRLREIDPTVPEAVDLIVSTCLQPDPAARYQTTRELLAALERLDENGIPLPEPTPIWRTWKFWATAASLTALLVSGTWWIAQILAPPVVVQRDPVSVLIADFTNGTGDPMFNGLLEQSLGVAVEGASFVTAYPRRDALRVAAQLKAGKTLDENVARIVAQREGVKVVIMGDIVPDGSGYKLSVRGINPDGTPSLSSNARATSKNEVLNAVGRLAGDIRKSLGDTKMSRRPAANEMLSASSLEAVAEYTQGQELTRQGRDEEAIPHFDRATKLDVNFGRAYSALGTSLKKLGRHEEGDAKYKVALSLVDRMTEREKYRTLGVYYLNVSKNFDGAIDNFTKLVAAYPSDAAAYNNLAVAYTNLRNFKLASENGRKALDIYPKNRLYRSNYALYSMYASDFKAAEAEAKKLLQEDPSYFMGFLPLAMEALSRGDTFAARGFYEQMAELKGQAASLANIGLADVAIVEGRTNEAVELLTQGIAADVEAKSDANAAVKRVAMAEAYALDGDLRSAVSTAQAAVKGSNTEPIVVPAGRIFASARRQEDIDDIVNKVLANQFEPQKRAYARILDALEYMNRGRYVDAVDSLNAAIKFADLWLARFYLGVAYETAGKHFEAFAEFDTCFKRRGETTALFFDEVPTYRYMAPLPYWLARAQHGLGQTEQARTNYKLFLEQKKGVTNDPMVADAWRKLDSIPTR